VARPELRRAGRRDGGDTATGFFCGAVAAGSDVARAATANPWAVVAILAAAVLVLTWAASRTRWRPSAPFRLAHDRAWGQILAATWRMYTRHARLFLAIGLLFIPIGAITALLQQAIFGIGRLEGLVDTAGEQNGLVAGLALGLGAVFTMLAYALVQAATARAMVELDAGRRVTAPGAYRGVRDSARPLLGALAIAVAVLVVLNLTVIGIPLAIVLLVRWSLLAVVVEVEEHPAPGALRRSARLVAGDWWRTFGIVLVVGGAGLMVGPLLGALVLLATGAAFAWVNVIAALVSVLVLPFAAIATTYLYLDLRVRKDRAAVAEPTVQELPAMLDLTRPAPAPPAESAPAAPPT
jgi:hypothetical protein